MKIIVGLGNYGDRYAYTYHNIGFLAAECLAEKLDLSFKKRECDASVALGFIKGEKVIIAKPYTYMNLSGIAIKQLLRKHKADLNDLIIIYDDIDLDKGTIRVREKGSAGTHNGMRSIISEIGSGDFCRIRIGIGRPCEEMNLADYVLSDIPKADRSLFFDALNSAADEVIKKLN